MVNSHVSQYKYFYLAKRVEGIFGIPVQSLWSWPDKKINDDIKQAKVEVPIMSHGYLEDNGTALQIIKVL